MSAHVYWRVLFVASSGGGGSDVWIDEVSFRSVVDADLSVGGTPLSSGEYNSTAYPTAAAFDKSNASLGWVSVPGVFPSWIGYQHPTAVDVASVLVTCADGDAGNETPVENQVFLQYSDDGVTWAAPAPRTFRVVGNWGPGQTVRLVSVDPRLQVTAPAVRIVLPGLTLGALTAHAGRAALRVDTAHGGQFRVFGQVAIDSTPNDIPVRRQVRLFEKRNAALVRQVFSQADTGEYTFDFVASGSYFVVAHDYLNFYDAVVHDSIASEPMP